MVGMNCAHGEVAEPELGPLAVKAICYTTVKSLNFLLKWFKGDESHNEERQDTMRTSDLGTQRSQLGEEKLS